MGPRVPPPSTLWVCRISKRPTPHALNPAERQLVALACTRAVQPLVLLLDEALNQLEPIHSSRVLADLRTLQRQVGMTMIMATTDSGLAMGIADKLAILHEGRLINLDQPDALYRAPRSALTARLTGPVNLVPGDVLRSSPGQSSTKAFAEVLGSWRAMGTGAAARPSGNSPDPTTKPDRASGRPCRTPGLFTDWACRADADSRPARKSGCPR